MSSNHPPHLGDYRKFAVDTAEAAGQLIRSGFRKGIDWRASKAPSDVVTSLDLAAEALIINRVQSAYPAHTIISEESGIIGSFRAPWTWLIDPLDGSNNIDVGMPVVAIGLTLCYESNPLVGVVHEPFVSRTWSAVSGRGAWQTDDQPLLRRSKTGGQPVIAWTQGYGISVGDHRASRLRLVLKGYARRVLELWAPLCAWAMLARGDIEGIVAYRVGELDLHGGALIASTMGVEIRDFDGSPFDTRFSGLAESRSLVAATSDRIYELLDLVSSEALDPIISARTHLDQL